MIAYLEFLTAEDDAVTDDGLAQFVQHHELTWDEKEYAFSFDPTKREAIEADARSKNVEINFWN